MPTFAEFCASRGYSERPTGARYVNLFEAWVRAECKAGRRPDMLEPDEKNRAGRLQWTRETALAALRDYHERTGLPVPARTGDTTGLGLPSYTAARRLFGTWSKMLREAGVPSGRRPNNDVLFTKEGK